ncbi:MAG: DUF983 domain-containing protein [Alphaproteobacteria bacterium]|nr:DUF983 domain-containing protein [Alphaproteobacteria bacterium]
MTDPDTEERIETTDDEPPMRPVGPSLSRGWLGRCPACGEGDIFSAYLKVRDNCPHCGEELFHQRADDAPPYMTIFVVAHVIVPLMIVYERVAHPPLWHHMTIGIGLTIALSLVLLPRIKGALIGIQWAKYMHGFGGRYD